MDQKTIKGFKERLLLRKDEMVRAYGRSKAYGMAADEEGAQDLADKAANSYTKEFLFSLSNIERDLLQGIDEALHRLEGEGYGTCAVCEGEVERKRLEAVPWATRCLSCQEKQEQGLL